MRKKLRKYFIPHRTNDYQPHLFREASVSVLILIIIFLFSLSLTGYYFATHPQFLAAIYPSVLVDLTNGTRIMHNAQPLMVNPILEYAAQLKANDMAAKGYFSHSGPDGSMTIDWFNDVNYKFVYAGENLAVNFEQNEDVENAWMNSPTHKANLINKQFTEIGIATAEGVYQGRPTTFVVQLFGTPAAPRPIAQLATSEQSESASKPAPQIAQVPVTDASTFTEVRGATVENEPVVKTIAGDQKFLALENTAESVSPAAQTTGTTQRQVRLIPRFLKLLANPSQTIQYAFWMMIALVVSALFLILGIEMEKLHMRKVHITHAVLLLIILSSVAYVNSAIAASYPIV